MKKQHNTITRISISRECCTRKHPLDCPSPVLVPAVAAMVGEEAGSILAQCLRYPRPVRESYSSPFGSSATQRSTPDAPLPRSACGWGARFAQWRARLGRVLPVVDRALFRMNYFPSKQETCCQCENAQVLQKKVAISEALGYFCYV